ncbi:MAG: hypothetical protein ACKO34_02030, partial [Vampirovibrionales bacterium]
AVDGGTKSKINNMSIKQLEAALNKNMQNAQDYLKAAKESFDQQDNKTALNKLDYALDYQQIVNYIEKRLSEVQQ